MFKRRFMMSVVLASLALSGAHLPAQAQLLDKDGVPYSNQYYRQEIQFGDIRLLRKEGLLPGQFVMRLTDLGAHSSGCGKMSNIPVEMEYVGQKIKVRYRDYTVDFRDETPGLPLDCGKNHTPPFADVILDSAAIKEKGIKKIELKHHKDFLNIYIEVTDHMARIWPPYAEKEKKDPESLPGRFNIGLLKSAGILGAVGGPLANSLPLESYGASTVWFYPENTVILYVPDSGTAKKDLALREKVDALAAARGLEPLEKAIPDFKSPLKDKHAFYYVAKDKNLAQENGGLLDYIQTDAIKFGLEADEPIKKNLAVFVRKPGLYE